MANVVRKGFTPVMMRDGSPYRGTPNPYFISSSDANDIYIGAPVVKAGSANSTVVAGSGPTIGGSGMPIGMLPTVQLATAGTNNRITGIVVGVGADPDDNARAPYRKASTNAVIWVEDDKDVLYAIPSDGAANAHTVGDIGQNACFTGSGGSTVTGRSAVTLDSTTLATTAAHQMRIVGLHTDPLMNDLTAANVSFLVQLNRLTEDPDSVTGL